MKGKKSIILVTILSISLVLSTQTSMALELGNKTDLANNVQEQNDKSSKTFSVEKSVQKTLDIVKQTYKNLAPKVGSANQQMLRQVLRITQKQTGKTELRTRAAGRWRTLKL